MLLVSSQIWDGGTAGDVAATTPLEDVPARRTEEVAAVVPGTVFFANATEGGVRALALVCPDSPERFEYVCGSALYRLFNLGKSEIKNNNPELEHW